MTLYDSPEDREFFEAIGRLVISWSYLELGIDGIVDILHGLKVAHNIEPEKPRSLKRKLNYLKKAIPTLSMKAKTKERYATLISDISTASVTRHNIIHGVVTAFPSESSPARFSRLTPGKGVGVSKSTITTLDVLRAAVEVQDLGKPMLNWTVDFHDHIDEYVKQLEQRTE